VYDFLLVINSNL